MRILISAFTIIAFTAISQSATAQLRSNLKGTCVNAPGLSETECLPLSTVVFGVCIKKTLVVTTGCFAAYQPPSWVNSFRVTTVEDGTLVIKTVNVATLRIGTVLVGNSQTIKTRQLTPAKISIN